MESYLQKTVDNAQRAVDRARMKVETLERELHSATKLLEDYRAARFGAGKETEGKK